MTLSYFRSYEPTSSYAGYGLACQVWASISLAIDTTIAGIMTWRVRGHLSHQLLSLLTSILS